MKTKILVGTLALMLSVIGGTANAAMTYQEALSYQSMHADTVFIVNDKVKDAYGEKNICRYFDLLGKNGVIHSGNTMAGIPSTTYINLFLNYGFENIPSEPFCYIRWGAQLAGDPDKGYEPKNMHIAFSDGFIKDLSLQGWEYNRTFVSGMLVNSIAHNYNGRVKLDDFTIYELVSHGPVAAVSMDDGSGAIKHFFYAGEKDLKNKVKFTEGLANAMKILQIDSESVAKKAEEMKLQQEAERKAKMRAEIEAEIKAEEEREAMKKQILAERAAAKAAASTGAERLPKS